MRKSETAHSSTAEVIRYFGFPLFAVIVLIIAFFATQNEVEAEIQKGTYQMLRDATLQQRITLARHVELLATRVKLIADYDSDTGPNTLVESLRTELTGDARNFAVGYANKQGYLLYSDQGVANVSDQDWFIRSLLGETVVAITSEFSEEGQTDVLVSAHVETKDGLEGVLFATLNGDNFSNMLDTLAYDGQAFSFVCDKTGLVLFTERGELFPSIGENVFDVINDNTLIRSASMQNLQVELTNQLQAEFEFEHDGQTYYAVCEAVGVRDWYVVSAVGGDAADMIQRQVGLYQMGMLFIMLLMGVALTLQAYNHERNTVKKLENDKDLLRQSAERYQLITQLSKEVFFEVNLDSGSITFNDSFEAMFGVPAPICSIERPDLCMNLFFASDYKLFLSLINRLRAGDAEARDEMRMLNARGIARWKLVEIFTIFDQNGNAKQLVGKIADIEHQKQSMQRLIRRADSEPLTGLLNRGALERNVKSYLTGEGSGGKHALLILDFDNFKAVNDTLGHAKGDNLLVSFAAGMKRLFRAGDDLSRIGGDEYMAFIKNIHADDDALDKAEAMRAEMAALSKRIGIPVSLSIGIAMYPRDGNTFEKLYKAADKALYQVKKNGKNAVALYACMAQTDGKELPVSVLTNIDSETKE